MGTGTRCYIHGLSLGRHHHRISQHLSHCKMKEVPAEQPRGIPCVNIRSSRKSYPALSSRGVSTKFHLALALFTSAPQSSQQGIKAVSTLERSAITLQSCFLVPTRKTLHVTSIAMLRLQFTCRCEHDDCLDINFTFARSLPPRSQRHVNCSLMVRDAHQVEGGSARSWN